MYAGMCSVDWQLVVSSLAAFGSIGAAVTALYIARGDRRERQRERAAASLAQARLVQVSVRKGSGRFMVIVQNYGDRAILDVALESAFLPNIPDAVSLNKGELGVVEPVRDNIVVRNGQRWKDMFEVEFWRVHVTSDGYSETREIHEAYGDPIIRMRFTDADGIDWVCGPDMPPERQSRVARGDKGAA